jgi:hypothetical protein
MVLFIYVISLLENIAFVAQCYFFLEYRMVEQARWESGPNHHEYSCDPILITNAIALALHALFIRFNSYKLREAYIDDHNSYAVHG